MSDLPPPDEAFDIPAVPTYEGDEPPEADVRRVIFPFHSVLEAGMGKGLDDHPMQPVLVMDLHALEMHDDSEPLHVLYRIPFPAEQAIELAEQIIFHAKAAIDGTARFVAGGL